MIIGFVWTYISTSQDGMVVYTSHLHKTESEALDDLTNDVEEELGRPMQDMLNDGTVEPLESIRYVRGYTNMGYVGRRWFITAIDDAIGSGAEENFEF